MSVPFGSFPFDAAGVDNFAHPIFINAMRAPTVNDLQLPGTQWQDSSVSPAIVYETSGGGNWFALSGGAGSFSTITTTGAITSGGNVIINGAGTQLRVHGGAVTDFIGTGTLVAGTVTIANTNIAATDRIFIQRTAANASTTMGELSYTISAGASFTVTSLILGTPASTQTGDLSSFTYLIVRQV